MNQERLMKIILAPIVSEKTSRIADKYRQFAFRVIPDATKPEVKAAVEQLFEVKVDHVNIANQKGKTKRFGQRFGKRNDVKKAYVTLKEGFDIDFVGAE